MEAGRPRPGGLTVLALIAAVALVAPTVEWAPATSRPVAAGIPFPVGAGVTVVPPPTAMVDLTQTRPGTALFLIGAIRYQVRIAPYWGSLEAAANRLRDRIVSIWGYQASAWNFLITSYSGLYGRQGDFSAPGRSGSYTVYVVDGLRIEVTVNGADPQVRAKLPGLDASTRSLAYHRTR
jgi:hypothetical protein